MSKRLTDKELADRYAEVDAAYKKFEKERKELTKLIVDRKKSVLRGSILNVLVSSYKRDRFDTKAFRVEHDDLYEEFKGESTVTTLKVTPKDGSPLT